MSSPFKQSFLGTTALYLYLFIGFGYPLTLTIPLTLGTSTTPLNISLRFIYLLTSLYLIVGSLIGRKTVKVTYGSIFLSLFWIIYASRLIYDITILNVDFWNNDPFWLYSFAFGSCFIPAVALSLSARFIVPSKIGTSIFWMLVLSNLAIQFNAIALLKLDPSHFLTKRILFVNEAGIILNPITISFYGELLAGASLCLLLFNTSKYSPLFKTTIVLGFILGLLNLLIGASRGPILSFALIATLLLFVHFRSRLFTYVYSIRLFTISLVVFGVTIFCLDPNLINELMITRRFEYSFAAESRNYLFSSAWNQFVASPIIGDQFVTRYSHSYPHNLVLEVLMSVGLLGFLPFFAFSITIFIRSVKILKYIYSELLPLVIVLMACFLKSLTSGALYTSVEFWAVAGMMASVIIVSRNGRQLHAYNTKAIDYK